MKASLASPTLPMSDRPPGPPDRARTFPKVGALRACLKPPTNRPAGPFSALEHRARRPLSPTWALDFPCPGPEIPSGAFRRAVSDSLLHPALGRDPAASAGGPPCPRPRVSPGVHNGSSSHAGGLLPDDRRRGFAVGSRRRAVDRARTGGYRFRRAIPDAGPGAAFGKPGCAPGSAPLRDPAFLGPRRLAAAPEAFPGPIRPPGAPAGSGSRWRFGRSATCREPAPKVRRAGSRRSSRGRLAAVGPELGLSVASERQGHRDPLEGGGPGRSRAGFERPPPPPRAGAPDPFTLLNSRLRPQNIYHYINILT